MKKPSKTIFVRVDRVGDFILTLPMETEWHAQTGELPDWVISSNVEFVAKCLPQFGDRFIVAPSPATFLEKVRAARRLSSILRKRNLERAVIFFAPWWIALAVFLSAIPNRAGVASKPWAWCLYNFPFRQRRSQSMRHESEYNFELVRAALKKWNLGRLIFGALAPLHLDVSLEDQKAARALLSEFGVGETYFVVHPGMGGSARNWPPLFYRELASRLRDRGMEVVVTGTQGDRDFIRDTGIERVPGVKSLVGKTPGSTILGVLKNSKAVVAPSTGVAHLAAAVGSSVVGIYSPVRVQAPLRWKPLGPQVRVQVPDVPCPGVLQCLGKACQYYDCMQKITVDQVFKILLEQL